MRHPHTVTAEFLRAQRCAYCGDGSNRRIGNLFSHRNWLSRVPAKFLQKPESVYLHDICAHTLKGEVGAKP